MRNGTRLRVTCGRCGQDRELIGHVCVIRSGRAARRSSAPKLSLDFGKCGTCHKPVGNPLTHVCAPRSDFRKRKRQAALQQPTAVAGAKTAMEAAERREPTPSEVVQWMRKTRHQPVFS